jgi:hypothetical protein
MAYMEKRLVVGSLLGTVASTYYTVTAPVVKTVVKEMTFCNTDSSVAYTFTLHVVPLSGSAGDANIEFKSVTLQPYETKIFGRTDVMELGSFIQGLSNVASKIAFSCSGVERT